LNALQALTKEQKMQIIHGLTQGLILKEDLKHLQLYAANNLPMFIDKIENKIEFLGFSITEPELERLMSYYRSIGNNQQVYI
jgi:hypothetical protein